MTDRNPLDSKEELGSAAIAGLVTGLRLYRGTSSLSVAPFGAGFVLRAATVGNCAEMPPLRRDDQGRKSTFCVFIGQQGRAELRHRGRTLSPAAGDMLIIDSDAGFSLESSAPHAHAVFQLPKAVLGERVRALGARAGELFAGADPKTSVVREALSQLVAGGAVLSLDERASGYQAALHLTDLLLTPPVLPNDGRLYARALSVIDRRLAEAELNPTSLARELRVSRRNLENVFAMNGKTISRYIWERRLSRAAEEIAADRAARQTLLQISARCGFASAAHFARAFSGQYGTSPSQFRVLQRLS